MIRADRFNDGFLVSCFEKGIASNILKAIKRNELENDFTSEKKSESIYIIKEDFFEMYSLTITSWQRQNFSGFKPMQTEINLQSFRPSFLTHQFYFSDAYLGV